MANRIKHCLIIDDDESFRQLIIRYLRLILPEAIVEEYDPVVSGLPPLDFDWSGCDLVILDYFLNTSMTGLDLLKEWKKQEDFPPVIMMTAAGNEDVAVRAMKSGVQDYLRKQNITREKLLEAILEAVKNHEEERGRRLTNSQNSLSFNKSLFYKKLEQPLEAGQQSPVFLLIELDQFNELTEDHGLIIQDSLLRHIARITYESYKGDDFQASITRMSDATIGLLFVPSTDKSLARKLNDLTSLLSADVYEHDGELIPYTVSIGAVRLADSDNSAEDIIRYARAACKEVRERGGNDSAIYQPQSSARREMPAVTSSEPPSDSATGVSNKSAMDASGHQQPQSGPAPEATDPPQRTTSKTDTASSPDQPSPGRAASSKRTGNGPADVITATRTETKPDADETAPSLSEKDLLEMTLELPSEKSQAPNNDNTTAGNSEDILQAFRDNRMLQYYQPIMPLSDKATKMSKECYSIRVRMVDTNGEIINAEQIVNDLKSARNQKLLDRWMLRQTVSRIVNYNRNAQQIPEFIIKLSEESVADAALFQWLQTKLMKQLGSAEPGKSIVIEITAGTYLARQRQVEALFKFLRQSYGFHFALSSFDNIGQLDSCIDKGRFSLYKINHKLLAEIQSKQSDPTAIPQQILRLRQKDIMVVATFVEDATMLTQAINSGADFAMGYFIGEPVDNIEEMTQVESFEIT